MEQYRIGIDVGGTFTDAVIIDNKTLSVVAKKKIPTSHNSEDGVATGIITIIKELLDENNINVENITFISHGTTQATNALLEGDVAKVGLLGMGSSKTAETETKVESIELAAKKHLDVSYAFLNSSDVSKDNVESSIDSLLAQGAEVIVASEAFSIEDPTHEMLVMDIANQKGVYATGGYNISQLFGLKLRSRTAVINGSLIPKMIETSNMTEKVIKELGIKKDLMIMRADGGVMTIDEVRKRPILTMLSGLAAGIAGAIMHEKITDGIFLEIGGTSTDISVIKDGKVMIKNASVGGHKTYLKSVDVQTIGIAGGTMIRHDGSKFVIGPRSAHLANLPYECFDFPENSKATILKIQPRPNDPDDYLILQDENGKPYSFTLCGAANYLGLVPKDDYAYSDCKGNDVCWEALGNYLNEDPKVLAKNCLDSAGKEIWNVITNLVSDYELEPSFLTLYGGGGSAGVFTDYLGDTYNVKRKIVANAPYISTIGVALAMITETIERSVVNPTEADIRQIREDITDKMLEMGALKETLEVSIEVDTTNHILIANATGTNEVQNDNLNDNLSINELESIAINSVGFEQADVKTIIKTNFIVGYEIESKTKKRFGLFSKKEKAAVIIGTNGIVKNRRIGGTIIYGKLDQLPMILTHIMDNYSQFSDAGQTIPELQVYIKNRSYNYAGLMTKEQVDEVITLDMEYMDKNEVITFMVTRRG